MRTIGDMLPHWVRLRRKNTMVGTSQAIPRTAPSWRALYVAAVSETDGERMEQRIVDAKKALIERARELFHAGDGQMQEGSAIDDALLALKALERSVSHLWTNEPQPDSVAPPLPSRKIHVA